MVEGLLVLDAEGNVLLINEQAEKMFHVSHEQMQTDSFVEISRSPEMRRILQEVMAFDFTNRVYSKTVSVQDGRWFRVNAVSLQNGSARPSGSILVFHDITEIQRLETVRSDFVANVSHELRTPLTAIRGYVETLLHNPPVDPRDANQFLTIIERHSERLSRLTERFYRVDKARSRELGGTGLGLAIVKHIVQVHGGELKIESVVQKGTTVRVMLPSAPLVKHQGATLFLCTGNSCRSQMAEGFARQLAPHGHRIFSAGTHPKGIHPLAIQVMREVGIDI